MNLDYVPLVHVMRDLHRIPRGQPPDFNGKKRFRQYLRTIFDYDRRVCKLPLLLAMNPMAKDHVTALLDAYLAMDADGIGARAAAEAAARLAEVPGDFKVGLVVCDDLLGGGHRLHAGGADPLPRRGGYADLHRVPLWGYGSPHAGLHAARPQPVGGPGAGVA